MKIKSVCEASGLTDRTIRYYIEEELLSPSFEENYLGRKTYDFSEEDVKRLQELAVLRKYGFSIAQIKQILLEPSESIAIIKDMQAHKQTLISQEQAQLQALLQLDANRAYTVSELAECLDIRDLAAELPSEDTEFLWSDRFWNACGNFSITWTPILLAVIGVLKNLHDYYYPKWQLKCFFFLALTLCPSILLLLRRRFKFLQRYRVKRLLFALCILMALPALIVSMGTVECSETRDFLNYREFDAHCYANMNSYFIDFFPKDVTFRKERKTADREWGYVYLDADYYYRYTPYNYSHDIYTRFYLKKGLEAEIERVRSLFEAWASDAYSFKSVQKGSYTCLFSYWGEEPFTETKDWYGYYMFAYNEETGDVRYYYGACFERDWAQPYYLSLTWD